MIYYKAGEVHGLSRRQKWYKDGMAGGNNQSNQYSRPVKINWGHMVLPRIVKENNAWVESRSQKQWESPEEKERWNNRELSKEKFKGR